MALYCTLSHSFSLSLCLIFSLIFLVKRRIIYLRPCKTLHIALPFFNLTTTMTHLDSDSGVLIHHLPLVLRHESAVGQVVPGAGEVGACGRGPLFQNGRHHDVRPHQELGVDVVGYWVFRSPRKKKL